MGAGKGPEIWEHGAPPIWIRDMVDRLKTRPSSRVNMPIVVVLG